MVQMLTGARSARLLVMSAAEQCLAVVLEDNGGVIRATVKLALKNEFDNCG